jgi:ankyrin repeat protein
MLEEDPTLLNKKAGPLGWEPLLYACYSRLDGLVPPYSTLEVARLLLAHGADPNAGFLWGATYIYTALTGAFGEGEDSKNELPHPHRDALATLLLDAGADPNDGQTLYNRHFRENDDHLKLLLSYGLGTDRGGPWFKRMGERAQGPARLLVEELWSAAKNNFLERVKLLVGRGVDVNTPGLRDGRMPYHVALRNGHHAVADYLLQHGAKRIELDRKERFVIACIAGQRDEAGALLAEEPTLLEQLGPYGRVELIHRAVEANSANGVRFITELGVDLNSMAPGTGYDRAPLHNAAAFGGRLEIVQLLLALGADPQLRDLTFHAKPIGWAAYGEQWQIVDYLIPFGTIFDAVQFGAVERVSALLLQDPSLANATDDDGNPVVFYLRPDIRRLAEMIAVLRGRGVDLNARRLNGDTVLDVALNRREDDFAAMLRSHGAGTAREM